MTRPSDPLTADEREILRAELERALARLTRSMHTTNRAARPVILDQTSLGRLSRIDAIQNQSLTHSLREREQIRAAQLTAALKKLDGEGYGLCEGCGLSIGFERLMLFPETPTCSACTS